MIRKHIAIIGDAFVDILCHPQHGKLPQSWGSDTILRDCRICTGGSACNTAIHLKSLVGSTCRVTLHTALGDDEFGTILRRNCEKVGVEVFARSGLGHESGVCVVISSASDRAFMTKLGAVGELKIGDLNLETLRSADHIHIGGYFSISKLQPDLLRLVRDLRSEGEVTFSLDTNSDADNLWRKPALLELLSEIDVFFPNEVEARGIADKQDVEEAAKELATRLKNSSIVTRGCEGAIVAQKGNDLVKKIPAPVVANSVDATGAGDAFNAAFLSRFVFDCELDDTVSFAVRAGAFATTFNGATTKLLSEMEN